MVRRLLFLVLWLLAVTAQGLENRLAGNPSPYLAMHGHDPVHWQPWSAEVLELARKEGKPLFISSGYFSCHWCHVMQRESYSNPEIAALLNRWFIPVKVDREVDPALDGHLIDFVQRTQGRAGWPLNVFLTPEGYPLAGFTYAPPERFRQILERFHRMWSQRREALTRLARASVKELEQVRRQERAPVEKRTGAALARRFLRQAMQQADDLEGGFGQQNRFPMQPQSMTLLELLVPWGGEAERNFLTLTLDQMASLGLRDQLGGGFFRYTVDPQWTRPHFEKMLYTQALLALLYLEAADRLRNPRDRQVAFDTLDFVLREMAGRDGGYVASFSAVDDEGREGGYYLWTRDQLRALLSPQQLRLALEYWRFPGLEGHASEGVLPLQGETVDTLARKAGVAPSRMARRIGQIRKRLLDARSRRRLPVDDKQLAGWNGLLLVALARAAGAPGGGRYHDPARRLAAYLERRHWNGRALVRARSAQGAPFGHAALEDYAYVAWGLEAWARRSGDERAADLADRLLKLAWARYHDARGWRSSHRAVLPGMPAEEVQQDGALPAPSAVILRLSLAADDGDLQQAARQALERARPEVQASPFWYASYVPLLVRADAKR